jgi:hypothetical protein
MIGVTETSRIALIRLRFRNSSDMAMGRSVYRPGRWR